MFVVWIIVIKSCYLIVVFLIGVDVVFVIDYVLILDIIVKLFIFVFVVIDGLDIFLIGVNVVFIIYGINVIVVFLFNVL